MRQTQVKSLKLKFNLTGGGTKKSWRALKRKFNETPRNLRKNI
jgi:hypothetical protein